MGDIQPNSDIGTKRDDIGVLMDNLINKGANLKEIEKLFKRIV